MMNEYPDPLSPPFTDEELENAINVLRDKRPEVREWLIESDHSPQGGVIDSRPFFTVPLRATNNDRQRRFTVTSDGRVIDEDKLEEQKNGRQTP